MRVFRLHAAMIGFLLSAFAGQSAGFTVEDFKQTRLKAERGDPEAPVALGSVFLGQGTPQRRSSGIRRSGAGLLR